MLLDAEQQRQVYQLVGFAVARNGGGEQLRTRTCRVEYLLKDFRRYGVGREEWFDRILNTTRCSRSTGSGWRSRWRRQHRPWHGVRVEPLLQNYLERYLL